MLARIWRCYSVILLLLQFCLSVWWNNRLSIRHTLYDRAMFLVSCVDVWCRTSRYIDARGRTATGLYGISIPIYLLLPSILAYKNVRSQLMGLPKFWVPRPFCPFPLWTHWTLLRFRRCCEHRKLHRVWLVVLWSRRGVHGNGNSHSHGIPIGMAVVFGD